MANHTGAVIAITPNPALDITIDIDELVPEATHRIDHATKKLGGKGVNVAAVAGEQGYAAYALGPVPGASIREHPTPSHVHAAFTDTPAGLRATYALHQRGLNTTTIINERGAAHPPEVFAQIVTAVSDLATAHPGSVVTISGSFPPGAPADFLPHVLEAAHAAGARVIVDTSGAPLRQACELGCDLVKPNAAELADVTGEADLVRGARLLLDAGVRRVVASDGAAGLAAISGRQGVIRARLDHPLEGNPTGAGDALVAALATGLIDGLDEPELLRRAVAWSAAAVRQPVAGAIGTNNADLAERVVITNQPADS